VFISTVSCTSNASHIGRFTADAPQDPEKQLPRPLCFYAVKGPDSLLIFTVEETLQGFRFDRGFRVRALVLHTDG